MRHHRTIVLLGPRRAEHEAACPGSSKVSGTTAPLNQLRPHLYFDVFKLGTAQLARIEILAEILG